MRDNLQIAYHAVAGWLDNPYSQALLILVGSFLAAKLSDVVITRVIKKITAKTSTQIDDKIVDLLHRPIFYSVALIGARFAIERLPLAPVYEINAVRVLQTVAIIIWSRVALNVTKVVLESFSRRKGTYALLEKGTLDLFENLGKAILFGAAVYFVFLSWDINVSAWLASAGILGLAVGLAAKDTIANLFGGVFIIADKPYKIGDFINLDTGDRGEVTHIGLRTTRLLTRADVEITVPNAVIAQATIKNETGGRWSRMRVQVKVAVAYGSDVDRVEEILLGVAIDQEEVCSEPEPRVRFRSFGDSGLDFELLCWIEEPVLRGRVLHQLNRGVYKQLNANEIEIPYPKHDVYLHQV